MVLGTTDVRTSIALAVIPPGNIIRELAAFRRRFFSAYAEPSAGAYFDFPVAAWLRSVPSGADLAWLAGSLKIPLAFSGLIRAGRDVFLALVDDRLHALASRRFETARADGASPVPGPFPSGLGCYCATLESVPEDRMDSVLGELSVCAPIGLKTGSYLIAAVELAWNPGPGRESSWAVLSSARSGKKTA